MVQRGQENVRCECSWAQGPRLVLSVQPGRALTPAFIFSSKGVRKACALLLVLGNEAAVPFR